METSCLYDSSTRTLYQYCKLNIIGNFFLNDMLLWTTLQF